MSSFSASPPPRGLPREKKQRVLAMIRKLRRAQRASIRAGVLLTPAISPLPQPQGEGHSLQSWPSWQRRIRCEQPAICLPQPFSSQTLVEPVVGQTILAGVPIKRERDATKQLDIRNTEHTTAKSYCKLMGFQFFVLPWFLWLSRALNALKGPPP